MNFYIVFCKTRKKFDKYIKINKIRNKVIIDIKEVIEEEDLDVIKYKDYFNLMIWTRITHGLKKSKDIFYIPDFKNKELDIKELLKLKASIQYNINFNVLIFFDEFQ